MKSNLPVPTAKNINDAHKCAKESAENAVEWAVKCGRLLAAKKEELPHGQFQAWVEKNCDFSYSTCNRYMKAGQNSHAGEISAIRHLFPSGQPGTKSNTQKVAVSVVNPEGGRTTGAKEGTEETGNDRPAAPVFDSAPAPTTTKSHQSEPEFPQKTAENTPAPEADDDEPERPDISDDEEAAALEKAEARGKADRERRIDAILQSEDQLAEAVRQIAQQSALIGVLETTRDGYMRGKDAVTKLLQTEQRKVTRLEKENKNLRERLDTVEGKAA